MKNKVDTESTTGESEGKLDRRSALAKLGLGVAAVYSAPVLLKLSEARASSGSSGGGASGGGASGGGASGGGDGPSSNDGPSAGDGPTSPTSPSSNAVVIPPA